jgi:hypothetical protein
VMRRVLGTAWAVKHSSGSWLKVSVNGSSWFLTNRACRDLFTDRISALSWAGGRCGVGKLRIVRVRFVVVGKKQRATAKPGEGQGR